LIYLAAALLLSKNSQRFGPFNLTHLTNMLDRKVNSFNHSIFEFFRLLLIEYDFENAYSKLKEFVSELKDDFFLQSKIEQIERNAQNLFFET